MAIDHESRANRLHLALEGLSVLLTGQMQGVIIEGDRTGCILALLAEEARLVAAAFDPAHPAGAND